VWKGIIVWFYQLTTRGWRMFGTPGDSGASIIRTAWSSCPFEEPPCKSIHRFTEAKNSGMGLAPSLTSFYLEKKNFEHWIHHVKCNWNKLYGQGLNALLHLLLLNLRLCSVNSLNFKSIHILLQRFVNNIKSRIHYVNYDK
jgi:hypothetical protein